MTDTEITAPLSGCSSALATERSRADQAEARVKELEQDLNYLGQMASVLDGSDIVLSNIYAFLKQKGWLK